MSPICTSQAQVPRTNILHFIYLFSALNQGCSLFLPVPIHSMPQASANLSALPLFTSKTILEPTLLHHRHQIPSEPTLPQHPDGLSSPPAWASFSWQQRKQKTNREQDHAPFLWSAWRSLHEHAREVPDVIIKRCSPITCTQSLCCLLIAPLS